MAFNIIVLVLVLAITFMHSVFGFYSGLINVFCTVTAVLVAFGFFEALNAYLTSFGLHPAYTEPACLIGLFIITVVVLRTLADNYIRGNVRVPMAVDWGGAAICGFINAQLFVGTLAIGVLMLPLRNPETGTVLQFARFERNPDERDFDHPELAYFQRNHLWTRADEFTVAVVELISGGSLRSKTTFASVYPDFTAAVFFSTNTVQPESTPSPYRDKKMGDGFEKGLRVEQWWEQRDPISDARYRKQVPTPRRANPDYKRTTFQPAAGKKLLAVALRLDRSAADRSQGGARHLFRPTMIRLVGQTRGQYQQYVPRVLANADPRIGGQPRVVDFDNNFSLPGAGRPRIYAYFEVDEDFQPSFIEYRRHARAALAAANRLEEPPELQLALGGVSGERDRAGRSGGKRTFGQVLESHSGDNSRLPFPMARRALQGAGDVRLDGDKLASGRVFGLRSRLEHAGEGPKVDEFKVPPGRRLIQVRYKPKQARTIVGDVFNYVAQLNQYRIVAANGDTFDLAGYYAIVRRPNGEYIELFYAGGPDEPTSAGYRHMLDFKNLERHEINEQDDTVIGLLFLVPPDTEFRRVENQAGDGGDIRLRSRR